MSADSLEKTRIRNRESQRRYRERIKAENVRASFVISRKTHEKIKEIAAACKIPQGEILDRLFGEGVNMETMTATSQSETIVDRFRRDDFVRAETALHVIGMMLGNNFSEIMEEERKVTPDKNRLQELEELRNRYLKEQRRIYKGDKETQSRCIETYGPILKARLL